MTDHQGDGMSDTPVPPAFDRARFTCPACHELADQVWLNAYALPR